jgi:hypothetical protein
MAVQTDIVGRIALNQNAVAYVRVSTKDQNEETQLQQLLAQGVPRENVFAIRQQAARSQPVNGEGSGSSLTI